MTLRLPTLLWAVLLVLSTFGLYMAKYRVQSLKEQVASVENQLRGEERNLHVLEAEWTYLNRPERLARLSSRYLKEKSVSGQQMIDFASLPIARPAAVMQQAAQNDKAPARDAVTLASGAPHGR